MKSLRSAIFRVHLAVGAAAGLVVLIMSVTGVALTYEKQMLEWADRRAWTAPSPVDARPLPPETLLAKAAAARPGTAPTGVALRADPAAPATVTLEGNTALLVDPYTGAIIGEPPAAQRSFFRTMTVWHRYLALDGASRATGKMMTGAANLGFLFLVVSGLYLWFPRVWTWPQFKNVLPASPPLAAHSWSTRVSRLRSAGWRRGSNAAAPRRITSCLARPEFVLQHSVRRVSIVMLCRSLAVVFVLSVFSSSVLAQPALTGVVHGSGIPATAQAARAVSGVLLLAHGGQPQWNQRVVDVARRVNEQHPAEVAFGMASRASIQGAIDKLTARGVTEIVAVPLFVSSYSSVITSTEYLLGLRKDAPKDMAIFAKMNHSSHGAPAADDHSAHGMPKADPASPVATKLPIRMTPALNRHAIVAAIVADRAKSISTAPDREAIIIVAHGPVPEDDNRRWLDDMAVLAQHTKASAPYASVDYMTVRDDAGPAMREAATKELRDKVQAQLAQGRRVLIVPHLMSFGGIERGLLKRLEGLDYTMTAQALMPDDRVVDWVLASIRP